MYVSFAKSSSNTFSSGETVSSDDDFSPGDELFRGTAKTKRRKKNKQMVHKSLTIAIVILLSLEWEEIFAGEK